jgi:hypothetical protein
MNVWFKHGTKALGILIAALSAATLLTPEQLAALVGTKGPAVALGIAGVLTFARGFKNTFTQGAQE